MGCRRAVISKGLNGVCPVSPSRSVSAVSRRYGRRSRDQVRGLYGGDGGADVYYPNGRSGPSMATPRGNSFVAISRLDSGEVSCRHRVSGRGVPATVLRAPTLAS